MDNVSLPLPCFDLFDDEEFFLLDEVVLAISVKCPDLVFTLDTAWMVIKKMEIEVAVFPALRSERMNVQGKLNPRVASSSFVNKITKRNAIRLYELACGCVVQSGREQKQESKYDGWQQRVNREYGKNKMQSHSDICRRLHKELGTSEANLKRRTKNPKK